MPSYSMSGLIDLKIVSAFDVNYVKSLKISYLG